MASGSASSACSSAARRWRAGARGVRCGVTIVLCGCSNLLYLLLISHPGNLVVLTLVISGENLTLGMLGPPTVAFLSSLVNRQHTATQYALLSSLVNLPGKLLGFFAGGIAMAAGYGGYFVHHRARRCCRRCCCLPASGRAFAVSSVKVERRTLRADHAASVEAAHPGARCVRPCTTARSSTRSPVTDCHTPGSRLMQISAAQGHCVNTE